MPTGEIIIYRLFGGSIRDYLVDFSEIPPSLADNMLLSL
jgi:hypothetical protein